MSPRPCAELTKLAAPSGSELYQIPGLPPDVSVDIRGCPFAPRCARAEAKCREEMPPLVSLTPEHESRCHFAAEIYATPLERPRSAAVVEVPVTGES